MPNMDYVAPTSDFLLNDPELDLSSTKNCFFRKLVETKGQCYASVTIN